MPLDKFSTGREIDDGHADLRAEVDRFHDLILEGGIWEVVSMRDYF